MDEKGAAKGTKVDEIEKLQAQLDDAQVAIMALANGAKLDDLLATEPEDGAGEDTGGLQGAREIKKLENVIADREKRLAYMKETHTAAISAMEEEQACVMIEAEIRLQIPDS